MPMDDSRQKLPSCFDCQHGAKFPCRDVEGNLDPDRLVNALRALANETPDTPANDEFLWALDCMDTIVGEMPELGFKLIVFALTYFKEPQEIGVLAAGPLENLVCFHGERMIDEIEREAADNERFRLLLSGIWAETDVNQEIWRRIQDAAGFAQTRWQGLSARRKIRTTAAERPHTSRRLLAQPPQHEDTNVGASC